MAKNYFTYEQVKELVLKVDEYAEYKDLDEINGFFLEELKDLMNLAVEAAIGNRLIVTGEFMHNKMAEELRKLPHGLSLYSVKELEN